MCVWTAYAGKKQAAPVIMEALKKIEGYWAGFYTGLAVCGEGTIRFDKCAGHTGIFEQQFSLKDYPGTTGIAHSRTNSGGGANRAHPFVGTEGKVALVSQGSLGVFAEDAPKDYGAELRRLYAAGRRMRSGSLPELGMRSNPDFTAPDGMQISLSDIVVNVIEEEYMKSGDMIRAMRKASGSLREESCSICIFADKPGVIGFINMNQRVCYAFEEDGVYMGNTMAAFPGKFMEIPGNSVGYVTAEGEFRRENLGDFKIETAMPDGLLPAAVQCLRENPGMLLGHLCDRALRPLFGKGVLDYHSTGAYNTLETLIKAGMVRYEVVEVMGQSGVAGRSFKWFLK